MATLPSSSRQTRSSSRRTRGPLQDLPLDQFLHPPSTSKRTSSIKRPISPGTPALYSPAKRRILSNEGLFATKIPLSAATLTTSSNKQHTMPPQHYHQTAARFASALAGPESPARRLDFGSPKNAGNKVPVRRPEEPDRQPPPFPEIESLSRSRCKGLGVDEDYFATSAPQSQTQPIPSSSSSSSSSGPSSQPQPHLEFVAVACEPRPLIDPQSEHYPGFVVYQDPHVLIPTSRLSSPPPPSTPGSVLASLNNNFDDDSDAESIDARDAVKENLPPRRKARKVVTTPMFEKTQLFSPPSAKSSSGPATPPREPSVKEREILTPRRLSIFGAGIGTGLGTARRYHSQEDRQTMRKILEDEVDGEQDD